MRILIVDDSKTVIHFVTRALQGDGCAVEALDSFVELPQVVRDDPPDLIILDLHMPAMSGRSIGRFIRQHQSRDIPIIIYSSRPEEELIHAARELGAVGFVPKGPEIDRLRREVATALANSSRACE